MLPLLEVIKKTADFFGTKGIESPRLNAELLIGHALGLKRMQLYVQFERMLSDAELETLRPLVRRRGQREPLQYIVGTVEFCGLKLKADRRALIPRPETELLVETVAAQCAEAPPARVLDLGTGTGAIALALAARWPVAVVTAIDSSAEALALARENAIALGLSDRVAFIESNWFAGLPPNGRFDLIIANPPYLSEMEVSAAAPEVRDYEPISALEAPENGLADLLAILCTAPEFLAKSGWLALETGAEQHGRLKQWATDNGWGKIESMPDLTGRDRFLFARRVA